MPLESLRQPFDPEQAGHKLREVQVESEPEKEPSPREKYEHIKNVYYREGKWRPYDTDMALNRGRSSNQLFVQSYLEQKIGIPTSETQTEAAEETTLDYIGPEAALMWVVHEPQRAKVVWQEKIEEHFSYDDKTGYYVPRESSRIPHGASQISTYDTLSLLHVLSCFDPEDAVKKLETLRRKAHHLSPGAPWKRAGRFDTASELLDILIVASFDPEKARKHYEQLKNSEAYDAHRLLWKDYMEFTTKDTGCSLNNQLYALLIEMRLEGANEKQKPLNHSPVKLPEERNF